MTTSIDHLWHEINSANGRCQRRRVAQVIFAAAAAIAMLALFDAARGIPDPAVAAGGGDAADSAGGAADVDAGGGDVGVAAAERAERGLPVRTVRVPCP